MDPLRLIADLEGVFLRAEAKEAGYHDRHIAAMLRQGIWRRVKHGCYVFADVWDKLTPEQQHLVVAHAVRRTTPGAFAFSHVTSLIAQGVAVWGADLSRVHLTRLDDGAARITPGSIHHVGGLDESDLTAAGGLTVTVASRGVIEAATTLTVEAGLVSADNACFRKLTDEDELRQRFEEMNGWPGSLRARLVVEHVDGRHESAGETRAVVLFRRLGIPTPEPQREVYDEHGQLVARVDFDWPELKMHGEFDGRGKYFRAYDPDKDPAQVVWEEKRREDKVRGITRCSFFRVVWHELSRPRELRDRFWDTVRRHRRAG